MRDKIVTAFARCEANNCLSVETQKEFYIVDGESGKSEVCYDSSALNYPFFTVSNPKEKEIGFLAIDKCIFFEQDGEKCDCAVFDGHLICFIEMKKALGKTRTRSKARDKAVGQLKETIAEFRQKIDFSPVQVEAILCVGFNTVYPRSRASNQNRVKEFQDDYNAELTEGNKIVFN